MHIDKRASFGIPASLTIALLLGHAAEADEGFTTAVSGYGTIGGTYSGNSAYTFVQNASDYKATNSQFDLGIDSRIGVQATFAYGTEFSVIVQEEAKRRGSEDFSLGTEWAFLQYTPTSDLKLRLGRMALATFLMSDYRDVGYAQPWFHAPNDIYAAEAFETLDGGEVLWHAPLGAVGFDLEGAYGTTSQTLLFGAVSVAIEAKYAYNLAATLTYDSFLLRAAETTVSSPLSIPLGPTTAVNYSANDKFLSLGFQYDNGKAIVLGEWAKRTENDIPIVNLPLGVSRQWYVAGGWRFDKLTPLVTYATYKPGNSLLSLPRSYNDPSVSLRYEVVSNVALKAQISRDQAGNGEIWTTANPASAHHINVFSLGADFVF
jgi:hypothetical protein